MPWHSYLLHEYVYFEQRMAVGLLMRLYFCKITLEIFNGNANVFVWHRSKQRKKTHEIVTYKIHLHITHKHISLIRKTKKKKKRKYTHQFSMHTISYAFCYTWPHYLIRLFSVSERTTKCHSFFFFCWLYNASSVAEVMTLETLTSKRKVPN